MAISISIQQHFAIAILMSSATPVSGCIALNLLTNRYYGVGIKAQRDFHKRFTVHSDSGGHWNPTRSSAGMMRDHRIALTPTEGFYGLGTVLDDRVERVRIW